jgi:hypothetical protein
MIAQGKQMRFIRSLRWAFGGVNLALIASAVQAAPLTQNANEGGVSLTPALAPILGAAIGVERAVEMIWNYIEWFLLTARRWQAADLKTAAYVQFKSGASLVIGLLFGVLVANITNMRLFDYLQPMAPTFLGGIPASWDVVLTGLLIGAGSKPAHDILGLLTQLKNFFANTAIMRREEAGRALAEGVLRLAQSESQGMVDVPGIGTTRLVPPGAASRGGSGSDEELSSEERSVIERYAAILRERTLR